MVGYYDLILGLIPLVLAGLTGALTLAGVEGTVAVVTASLLAGGVVGHAMFARPPTGANTTEPSTAPPAAAD